LLNERKEVQ